MTSLKSIARTILSDDWNIDTHQFDVLWDYYLDVRYASPREYRKDPPLATVFLLTTAPDVKTIFAALTQLITSITTPTQLEQVLPHLDAIMKIIGREDLTTTLTAQLINTYSLQTIVTPTAGTLYHHEQPPLHLSHRQLHHVLQNSPDVDLIIHQPVLTNDRQTGKVLVRCGDEPFGHKSLKLPPIQYRVLVHLLKHHHDPQERTLADLIEHCWHNTDDATKLRDALKNHNRKLADVGRHAYDVGINKLSTVLQEHLNIKAISGGTGVWELQPWPTYCIIEEQ